MGLRTPHTLPILPAPGSALLTLWTTAPPNAPPPGAASGVCCDLAVLCVSVSQTPAQNGPSSPVPKAPNHRVCARCPCPRSKEWAAVGAGLAGLHTRGQTQPCSIHTKAKHRRERPWLKLPRGSGRAGTGGGEAVATPFPDLGTGVGKIPWRRKWQSTPGLLPGKSHGQRSLVGYSPWDRKESDTTERPLHFTQVYSACGNLPVHICQRYTFL